MKHFHTLFLILPVVSIMSTQYTVAQDQTPSESQAVDAPWHTTSQNYSESGHEYLLNAIRDEVQERVFDDPATQQRYNKLNDWIVKDGSNYGIPYVNPREYIKGMYQELLALDNPPPLYIQYRYHGSQPYLNESPKETLIKHADALLEIAYQMDHTGYPPYIAASTWLKAAQFLTKANRPEDQNIIAHIREHGIELLVQAAALEGVEPQHQEFVSERIANFGFQYITLPREEQEVLCRALLDSDDAEPWIGLYSSGGLRVSMAWDARGRGFSNTVTAEGWKGFERHLVRAHRHLTRAWERKPHWPQPATKLITATMGHQMRTDRSTAFWFEQAINARTDHWKAYKNFNYDLLPKWHGSIQHLDGLAQFIINRSDEHQNMGRILINTVSTIAGELDDPYAALQNERYLPHMTRLMLDEVKVDLEYNDNAWRSRSLRAVALGNFRAGQYDTASQLLRAGGGRTNAGWSMWKETSRFRQYATLLGSPAYIETLQGIQALDNDDANKALRAFKRAKKVLRAKKSEINPDFSGDPFMAIDLLIERSKP